jgi:peptidoglycan/LPS O-acetylase OafA/YrhL
MGDKLPDTSEHRLASLAALRGLAILLVIVGHFAPSDLTRLLGTAALSHMAYGGVILFFVLSGFLMDRTLNADRSLTAYVIRRAARILPLYWISLLIALALGAFTLRDLAANAFFLVPLTRTELMSGVYWTLYVEVLFYALAPFLVHAGDRAIVASLWLVIAADVAVFVSRGTPSHALFHLTFCLMGMSFGAWYRGKLTPFGLALAVAAVTLHAGLLSSSHGIALAIAPLASAILMWLGLRDVSLRMISSENRFPPRIKSGAGFFGVMRVVSIAPMSFLGAVSYGWYLLHAVIGLPLMAAMLRVGWSDWQAALFGALVSLLLSWGAHVAVEKPGIAFGRRLQKGSARAAFDPSS